MPPYRANLPGMFGSGMQPRVGAGNVDIAGAIGAIGNQASSLIQSAYLRKLAERERADLKAAQEVERADKIALRQTEATRRAEDVAFRERQLKADELRHQAEVARRERERAEDKEFRATQARDARAALANRGPSSAQQQVVIGRLASRYDADPIVKNAKDVAQSLQRIISAEDSAVGDLSLIFGYMKMLDPGSVVREGEFANAQNAAGIPDQVRNLYNRAMSGERLNPTQREAFQRQARTLSAGQRRLLQQTRNRYVQQSKSLNVDPDILFDDPFLLFDEPTPAGAPGVVPRPMVGGSRPPYDPNDPD